RRPRPGAARLVPDQRAADSRRSLARDARQSCRRAAARAGHGGTLVSLTATAGPRPRATRIAVTSGKGGVGKTSLTINLAVAMARLGHRVGILDADFALGNIDVMLGLTPDQHLGAVLDGVLRVQDVTLDGPAGVRIIPAGSGVRALTALDDERWLRLVAAIDEAGRELDFLFFD